MTRLASLSCSLLVAALATLPFGTAEGASPSSKARAEALYQSALQRLQTNDIDERRQAIHELEQATLLDRANPTYELLLARVYYRCGFIKNSRSRFERVVRMAPNDADGRYGLGQVWRRDWLKFLDDSSLVRAIDHFSNAAKLRPQVADAWLQLVPLLVEHGELPAALAASERGVMAEPHRADAELALAYTSYRSGNVHRADSLFRDAVPRVPRTVRERFEDISPVASERDTFVLHRLSRADQKEFIERFWRENDPDLASPENEAQLEYWSRVAHAYFLFFDPRRREWDERGEVYVRYGPPGRRIYNPVPGRLDINYDVPGRTNADPQGGRLEMRFATGPGYPANLLVWDYPDLGMTVQLQDRMLNENYMLPIRTSYDPDPAPNPDSLARREDALAVRGGRGVFPKLPPGVQPLEVKGIVAHFEVADRGHLVAQVESPGQPGDSLWADWVVLDSTRHEVARGGRSLSPSACEATTRRVADFATELPPGEYLVGLSVRDGRGHRGVFRTSTVVERAARSLALSDVVISCGPPNVSGGREVRIEPNPAARVSGAGPLTAYFEIYHLSPGGDGQSRFEYVYTVKSAEKDTRVWLQRLISPRKRPADISVSREAENTGPLRRMFVTVPVEGLPLGNYKVEVTVRDLVAGTEVTRATPFVKVGDGLRN